MIEPDDERFLFSAADMLAHRRKMGIGPTFDPPLGVILCLQNDSLVYGAKLYKGRKKRGFNSEFYLLNRAKDRVGIVGRFGAGAPVTAALLEELAAFGVKRFVSVGICGGLDPRAQVGELVVARSAIRDEGTSRHYLPPSAAVDASAAMVTRMELALASSGQPFRTGTSWTTDAPYREKLSDLNRYQKAGVLAVEMEAAALFAVTSHLGVGACAAFVVADSIEGVRWRLEYDVRRVRSGLERLVDAAVLAILS